MKTNNPKLLFLACMLAVLFACNSDSPKVTPRSTTSNTATNLPGTGLMTVNMVSPANGALNVRSDTNIILVFSEEVDFTTLTGAVTITGSLSGGHAFTGISGDSTVYSLNPTVNFTASEVVTVTLTSTTVDPIESTGGKDLYTALPSTTISFSFTVAATTATQPGYTAPVIVAPSRTPAPGATNVPVTTTYIAVAFDKAVAVDSTDYTIIGSTSGAAIKSAAAPSTIDAGITWQLPINVPAYGETVTVELNSGIVDATYPTIRLRLDGNEYWSFDIESNTIPAAVTISSIYVNNLTSSGVGNATATVHWTTNKPDATTGSVDFGTDTTYGGAAVNESSNYTTVHSVTLAGLSENTKYYYQITSGAGTNTGTFFTTNSTAPAGNPGTLAYTDGSDSNSGMVVVQNENNFAMDGSSYLFWINSNAVCGIHWTAAGGISATNTVIGAGTSVEAASDGYGRAVAAWVNGANIFGSIVDSAMTSTAFNSGFAIASGANPSVVIVWDPFVNNITNGTAEVFADNALYIYDYSNDFSSAVTAIAAGDYIFNTATASCTTAPNAYNTGITATYRHVLSQDTNDYVNSGDSYCIADASSAYPALLPASVADYYVYESSPQALITSYLNTLSGNPLDNIYSPYTSTFSLAQAVVGDLVEVNSAYYRRIASVDEITFGTAAADHIHTVDYSGTTDAVTTTNKLIDTTQTFPIVTTAHIVQNSSGDYAQVTDVTNASNGELVLSASIFTSTPETYYIYSLTDILGMYILNGVTASANTGYIIDTNAASSDLTGVSTATDIVLDNDGGYEYSNISSVDIGFDIIYLTDPILEGVAGENYILYRKTQDFTGTSANLLLDTGTDFSATSAPSDIVENSTVAGSYTYTKVLRAYNGALAIADADFTTGSQSYNVYNGRYNTIDTTPLPNQYPDSNLFTSFVAMGLTPAGINIPADAADFTIYDTILTGIADVRPTNPLFDNTGTFITDSVVDDYLVVNATDRAWSRVETAGAPPFTVKERALDMLADIMSSNGSIYHILDFNPAIADSDILDAGRATTAGNPFTDTNANFIATGISEGDIIYNMTDQTYAVITVINSAQQLTLSANVMDTLDDAYMILDHVTVSPNLQSVSRALVTYSRGGNIHAQRVNLSDGSLYGAEIDIDSSGSDSNPCAVSNGLGGAFIVYQNGAAVNVRSCDSTGAMITAPVNLASSTLLEARADGSGGLYVLRTDGTSVILGRYTTNGLTVSTAWTTTVGTGTTAALAVDPSGDPIVAYVDASTVWPRNIQVLGLLQSDGSTAAGYPEVILTSLHPYLTSIVGLKITSDRTGTAVNSPGGVIVTWADDRYYSSLGYDIFAQAVNDSGALADWTADPDNDGSGTLVGVASSYIDTEISTALAFYADGGTPYGGLFLWFDYRNDMADIYYRLLSR